MKTAQEYLNETNENNVINYILDQFDYQFERDIKSEVFSNTFNSNTKYKFTYKISSFFVKGIRDARFAVPDLRNKIRNKIMAILFEKGFTAKVKVKKYVDEIFHCEYDVVKITVQFYAKQNQQSFLSTEKQHKFYLEAQNEKNLQYVKYLFWWRLK